MSLPEDPLGAVSRHVETFRRENPCEPRVLAVHARRPGFTARGFERSGSYDRLAAEVPAGARVLDLACGDGALLARLPAGAIGIDVSPHELALACSRFDAAAHDLAPGRGRDAVDAPGRGRVAATRILRARAQALPFADAAFDILTCHLAFMLLDDIDRVVAETDRVLASGGSFLAMLGGGPLAEPASDDAFPIFLELLAHTEYQPFVIGDPRSRNEWGWEVLFPGWERPAWERCELVLDGSFDDVWSFFEASYELPLDPAPLRAELARRLAQPMIRCRAVTWLARATKPSGQGSSAISTAPANVNRNRSRRSPG